MLNAPAFHGAAERKLWSVPETPEKILDVLVDLKYRGDYTPASRGFLQAHVANNDIKKFKAEMVKESNWAVVIKQARARFEARRNYL